MWGNVTSDVCAQRRLESACASAQSDQSLRCPHEELLHPWLIKMHPVKILIRLRKSHADQNLRWAHISEGTFSDFEVHIKSKGNSPFNKVWIQIIICLFRIGLLNLGKINNLTNEYFETAIIMTSYIATMQSTQISCFQLFFWIWDRWRYLGLPNKLYERNETQALLT